MTNKQPVSRIDSLALSVDVTTFLIYLVAGGWLQRQFAIREHNFSTLLSALLMSAIFILFLIGVNRIKRLHTQPATNSTKAWQQADRFLKREKDVRALAVVFGLWLAVTLAHLSGFISTMFTVDFGDMGTASYFLFTSAIFFALGFVYLLTWTTNSERTIATGTPKWRNTALFGLATINFMFITAAAWFSAIFELNATAVWLRFLIIGSALLLLFVLPRLLYLQRSGNYQSWTSFVGLWMLVVLQVVLVR